jgi:hypothetical protein
MKKWETDIHGPDVTYRYNGKPQLESFLGFLAKVDSRMVDCPDDMRKAWQKSFMDHWARYNDPEKVLRDLQGVMGEQLEASPDKDLVKYCAYLVGAVDDEEGIADIMAHMLCAA